MGATLDHKINKGLVTTVLGTPDVSFMNGGKSFTLRDITVSGFKPHSRGKAGIPVRLKIVRQFTINDTRS